jgi:hypothetical protein
MDYSIVLLCFACILQSTSSSKAELARLQDTQKDMVSKLASAERELAQLRASSRTAGEALHPNMMHCGRDVHVAGNELAWKALTGKPQR